MPPPVLPVREDIPAELLRRPPAATLDWVGRAVGPRARVTRVRRLRNSWAAAMHAVDVADGDTTHRLVLRRWARADWPPDEGVVANETAALRHLAATSVSTPSFVAADADARATDVPALLMTRLPGRVVLQPARRGQWLRALADALRGIHALDAPPSAGLFDYRPWNVGIVNEPPAWTTDPASWRRAIDVVAAGVPIHERRVLCHRDFHPGNVLWARGQVSGIVDWTHACSGPPAVDVAHCRLNLAMLFDLDAADEFAASYGAVDDLAWFDVADAFGTGSHAPDAWRWDDGKRADLTPDVLIARLDAFLADALSRIRSA